MGEAVIEQEEMAVKCRKVVKILMLDKGKKKDKINVYKEKSETRMTEGESGKFKLSVLVRKSPFRQCILKKLNVLKMRKSSEGKKQFSRGPTAQRRTGMREGGLAI